MTYMSKEVIQGQQIYFAIRYLSFNHEVRRHDVGLNSPSSLTKLLR